MITDLARSFSTDDIALAYDRWGTSADGVPFLLCHGFSGSAHDFALSIEELAEGREVVAIDHRGHGRSAKVGDAARYSVGRLATDLIAFVDGEIGGPVDLLGHSMGGAIALRVTLARPDLVRSLILMDTSGWSFVPQDSEIAALMAGFIEAFDPAGGLPDLSGLPNAENALIEAGTPAEWRAVKAQMDAGFDPYALKALGRELFEGGTESVRSLLGDIACPVSVLVGELDHPFVDQAPELAASVADGRLTVIAGAYHSPQLTHRAEWTAAVEAHLARR